MTTKKHDKNHFRTKGPSCLFHPFEIAFCGYSNSGKTTLIAKLIDQLKAEYDIGYVKHDVHRFQMDKEGKDTFKAWNSGASQVLISDPRHTATIYQEPPDMVEMKSSLLKRDFVFLEGYKNSIAEKIVVIDKDEKILKAVVDGEINNIIGFVGTDLKPKTLPLDVPSFHRDDTKKISDFVKDHFKGKAQATPLFGLVLAGGHSTRMKSDKALLEYFGKSQAEVCYELLGSYCESTFISSRSNQWSNQSLSKLPQIHDAYMELGPLGGILTAMQTYPDAAWLVAACDLPFLDSETLHYLVENRNPFKVASCFQSEKDNFPEPLCTVYEPKAFYEVIAIFRARL